MWALISLGSPDTISVWITVLKGGEPRILNTCMYKEWTVPKYQRSIRSWPLLGTVIIFLASASGNLKLLMKICIKLGLSILRHGSPGNKVFKHLHLPSFMTMHIQVLSARNTEFKQMQSKTKLPEQHWNCGQQHYFSLFIDHINYIYYMVISVIWVT